MVGRKTDCTPETIKIITDNIKLGLSNRDSCALAGITEATFYAWLQRADIETKRVEEGKGRRIRAREAPFIEFSEAVKRAKPTRKQVLVARIQTAAQDGQWQAAAWLLERLHFEEFGRRQMVEVRDWRESLPENLDANEVQKQFAELLTVAAQQVEKGNDSSDD
jgi:hypothetical protein